ncbi:addiction module protein [Piscinibacter sp.]|uniref:addiction module protein n=1 Tax=Piscinibacter sp. TaxID=1903157 RepID=UPI0039E325F0
MPSTVTDLEVQALRLAPEERAQLADRLLASLSADTSIEEEWATEAHRRLAELEAGTVAAIPIEAAIARARNAIR